MVGCHALQMAVLRPALSSLLRGNVVAVADAGSEAKDGAGEGVPQPVAAFLCGENTGRNDAGETVSIHLASCSLVRVALLHLLLEPSLASWKLHAALLRLVAVARELALMAAMATVDAADHDATIAGACVSLVPWPKPTVLSWVAVSLVGVPPDDAAPLLKLLRATLARHLPDADSQLEAVCAAVLRLHGSDDGTFESVSEVLVLRLGGLFRSLALLGDLAVAPERSGCESGFGACGMQMGCRGCALTVRDRARPCVCGRMPLQLALTLGKRSPASYAPSSPALSPCPTCVPCSAAAACPRTPLGSCSRGSPVSAAWPPSSRTAARFGCARCRCGSTRCTATRCAASAACAAPSPSLRPSACCVVPSCAPARPSARRRWAPASVRARRTRSSAAAALACSCWCIRPAYVCGGWWLWMRRVMVAAHTACGWGVLQLVILRDTWAAFYASPYVDHHGEQDLGFRRGLPLTLSEQRYEAMTCMWGQHKVRCALDSSRPCLVVVAGRV